MPRPKRWPAGAVLSLVLAAIPSPAVPQGAAPAPQAYRPGLGDLMTMTVQPRHIKLGRAGESANWAYAAYELHELEEAFERIAKVWPQWRKFAIVEPTLIPKLQSVGVR